MKHSSHGEVNFFKSEQGVPLDAVKVEVKKGMYIVADSEVTGNHHYIPEKEGVELFEKDGVLYLKNTVESEVKCVIESRHSSVPLEKGIWEIDKSLEYDYLAGEIRECKD